MNIELKEIENILDEEIQVYLSIEKCEQDKKDILIKGDINALVQIDEQIYKFGSVVKDLAIKRKSFYKNMGSEHTSLSEIIEKTRAYDKIQAEIIKEKRNKIMDLLKNIYRLDSTNKELVKHSLKLVKASVNLIVKSLNPGMNSYTRSGRINENAASQGLSSIIEEA